MDLEASRFDGLRAREHKIRVVGDEDKNVWFVVKDVASILGYTRPENAIRDHVKPKHKRIEGEYS